MTDQPQPTDWSAAWTTLSGLDGPEWDAGSERLNKLWKAGYVAAFVAEAVSRNWTRENAEIWAGEVADEALGFARDADPVALAHADVAECEREARNAR